MKVPLLTISLAASAFFASLATASDPLQLSLAIDKQSVGSTKDKNGGSAVAEDGSRIASISRTSQNNNADHFHVIVTNTSDRSQFMWIEACSWGRDNLSFELTDDKGNKTVIKRKSVPDVGVDSPVWWDLSPHESHVFDIYLSNPQEWTGFPAFGHDTQVLTIQAIYEIGADKLSTADGVWTGKIVSKPVRVKFRDFP